MYQVNSKVKVNFEQCADLKAGNLPAMLERAQQVRASQLADYHHSLDNGMHCDAELTCSSTEVE